MLNIVIRVKQDNRYDRQHFHQPLPGYVVMFAVVYKCVMSATWDVCQWNSNFKISFSYTLASSDGRIHRVKRIQVLWPHCHSVIVTTN